MESGLLACPDAAACGACRLTGGSGLSAAACVKGQARVGWASCSGRGRLG